MATIEQYVSRHTSEHATEECVLSSVVFLECAGAVAANHLFDVAYFYPATGGIRSLGGVLPGCK